MDKAIKYGNINILYLRNATEEINRQDRVDRQCQPAGLQQENCQPGAWSENQQHQHHG